MMRRKNRRSYAAVSERFHSRLAADGRSPQELVGLIKEAAILAGEYILSRPQESAGANLKPDGSILTPADIIAESIIRQTLMPILDSCIFVGEESANSIFFEELNEKILIFVDPLDGTREYYSGSPDYTVNIGIVFAGQPICGVVFAPAHDELYWASPEGAYRASVHGTTRGPTRRISVATLAPPVIVTSRSRGDTPEVLEFIRGLGDATVLRVGSSLKFCRIAEGKASYYPCLGDTYEWDTAAGQAILEAAGGAVNTRSGERLTYGKLSAVGDKNFLNPHFIASSSP